MNDSRETPALKRTVSTNNLYPSSESSSLPPRALKKDLAQRQWIKSSIELSSEENCLFCRRKVKMSQIPDIIHHSLYKRYCSSLNYYYTKDLNRLLGSSQTREKIVAGDYSLLDKKEEHLEGFYPREDWETNIESQWKYHQFNIDQPRFFEKTMSPIMNSYFSGKRKLQEKAIRRMLELLSDSELERCDLKLDNYMNERIELEELPIALNRKGDMLQELYESILEKNKRINRIVMNEETDAEVFEKKKKSISVSLIQEIGRHELPRPKLKDKCSGICFGETWNRDDLPEFSGFTDSNSHPEWPSFISKTSLPQNGLTSKIECIESKSSEENENIRNVDILDGVSIQPQPTDRSVKLSANFYDKKESMLERKVFVGKINEAFSKYSRKTGRGDEIKSRDATKRTGPVESGFNGSSNQDVSKKDRKHKEGKRTLKKEHRGEISSSTAHKKIKRTQNPNSTSNYNNSLNSNSINQKKQKKVIEQLALWGGRLLPSSSKQYGKTVSSSAAKSASKGGSKLKKSTSNLDPQILSSSVKTVHNNPYSCTQGHGYQPVRISSSPGSKKYLNQVQTMMENLKSLENREGRPKLHQASKTELKIHPVLKGIVLQRGVFDTPSSLLQSETKLQTKKPQTSTLTRVSSHRQRVQPDKNQSIGPNKLRILNSLNFPPSRGALDTCQTAVQPRKSPRLPGQPLTGRPASQPRGRGISRGEEPSKPLTALPAEKLLKIQLLKENFISDTAQRLHSRKEERERERERENKKTRRERERARRGGSPLLASPSGSVGYRSMEDIQALSPRSGSSVQTGLHRMKSYRSYRKPSERSTEREEKAKRREGRRKRHPSHLRVSSPRLMDSTLTVNKTLRGGLSPGRPRENPSQAFLPWKQLKGLARQGESNNKGKKDGRSRTKGKE